MSDTDAPDVATSAATAVLLAGASAPLVAQDPSLAPAVAGAAPVLEWLAIRTRVRIEGLLQQAVSVSGHSGQEFSDRLTEKRQREQLVLDAVTVTQRTVEQAKLRQLAYAISRGVFDDAELDESQQIVGALERIDPVHLAVLTTLVHLNNPNRENRSEGAWTTAQLADKHPNVGDVLPAVLSALVATGCMKAAVGNLGDNSVDVWVATSFGQRLLEHVERAAEINFDTA